MEWLTSERASKYSLLTTPSLRSCLRLISVPDGLSARHFSNKYYAVGIDFAAIPAGLCLLSCWSNSLICSVTIKSLFVDHRFRNIGLASQLVSWIRSQAKSLGWNFLAISYPVESDSKQALQALTRSTAGWCHDSRLVQFEICRKGSLGLLSRLSPSYARISQYKRFSFVSFCDLELAILNDIAAQLQAPLWSWPLVNYADKIRYKLDQHVSRVLYDKGVVVGWLAAYSAGRMLVVSQLWIAPGYRGFGPVWLLLRSAIQAGLDSSCKYEFASFCVEQFNQAFLGLCDRKLAPYLAKRASFDRFILDVSGNQV